MASKSSLAPTGKMHVSEMPTVRSASKLAAYGMTASVYLLYAFSISASLVAEVSQAVVAAVSWSTTALSSRFR